MCEGFFLMAQFSPSTAAIKKVLVWSQSESSH
jgi:hypothetical protein